MVSIYNYTDYRKYLKEKFEELKKTKAQFSYRYFNRLAGIKSSGFLKLVIDGKRNLADEGISKIAKGLQLSDNEKRFFFNLVKFNQASTHEEKEYFFTEISKNKGFIKAKSLIAAQYALFSHWYYVAILELVRLDDQVTKNLDWLSHRIYPTVGIRELKKAVKDLKKLKLITQNHDGSLSRQETMLTTPDEVQSVAVSNFHIQMSNMASWAVEHHQPETREFSALTSAMSQRGFQLIKRELQEFRRKIHSILEQEDHEEKEIVGHMNLQLFQLSHKISES